MIPLDIGVSEVLGQVVGKADITDIKIIETNTDEIVRSIYQAGSAEKNRTSRPKAKVRWSMSNTLGAYIDFIRIRFLTMLAYRVNYYSGILIYTLNIGVYYFTWKAIYGGGGELGGFTASQMTTYLAVSWMARAFYFNNLDREISTDIRDGSIAIQFIRPYNYLMVKMMQGLGEGMFRFMMLMIPGMAIAMLLYPVKLPTAPSAWAGFLVMLFFSFLINSQLNVITGLMAFSWKTTKASCA